jgi:DNA-binding MarR family transcriptional regulator
MARRISTPSSTIKDTRIPIRLAPMPLARRFMQICTTAMAQALDREDLTPLQYGVLAYVWGEPDLDQVSLASRVGIDRTNVGLLVDQLEAKGLITRRIEAADRRVRLVRLTDRGDALHRRIAPVVRRGQDRLLEVLNARDRKAFLSMLVRVIDGNEALARPGTGRRKRAALPALGKKGDHHVQAD